jgi:prophage DNA circulation protein
MRQLGLRSKTVKKWKLKKASKTVVNQKPNLLQPAISIKNGSLILLIFILYKDSWCYLSTIQDLHTKKIIAF